MLSAGIALDGASDHGVSEALYLRDPDDNGVELYRDRPQQQWPHTPDGKIAMFSHRSIWMICCDSGRREAPLSPSLRAQRAALAMTERATYAASFTAWAKSQ